MFNQHMTEADHLVIEREIEPFLPDRIFDSHAHLFCHAHFQTDQFPASLKNSPPVASMETYRHFIGQIHPRRQIIGGLFFPLPFVTDREASNQFVAAEVNGPHAGRSFGQMLVWPEMDPDLIRREVREKRFVGLKCYHVFAKVDGPTWHAPIATYLTESHVQIADEMGLSITLHMVRDRALADPVNQQAIRYYCERYPRMRLILAHAARGFNPWHTIEGIHSLQGLRNVWFDTSAVTEAGAFEAIVDVMGHERLLYGSDFHVSHLRGRCVAIGDSFHWFYADDMNLNEEHATLQPVLIGLESLRSLRLACQRLRLTDSQIEAIFYRNAAQLFPLGDQQ